MITPYYQEVFFTPAECRDIIATAERKQFQEAGLVKGHFDEDIRIVHTAWLDDEEETAWIFRRLFELVLKTNRQHFQFHLDAFAERIQIARYDACLGSHFDWHADWGTGTFASKRKLTLIVQLSDPASYQGGLLCYNAAGVEETASTTMGSVILFPSFVLHKVSQMTSGLRYSLTTWIHGPAFT